MLVSLFSLSRTRGRVLVFAANPTLTRTIVVTLRSIGYDAQFAPEPSEWQNKLTDFDLVILANSRPVWFSERIFDICSAVRRSSPDVPIIVVGPDDLEAKVRLFEIGADDYIVEPFDLHEFLARVKSLIRRQTSGEGN